jgi:hypothetical protein
VLVYFIYFTLTRIKRHNPRANGRLSLHSRPTSPEKFD